MVFAAACGDHAVTAKSEYWELKANGTTTPDQVMREAITAYESGKPFNKKYVDYCPDGDLFCNKQCHQK